MNPVKPKSTFPIVERWRSRAEILQEHLDSLPLDELRRVRPSYYWLRYGLPAWQRECARKYDPNQPRVSAGNSDGGQWTSGPANSGMQPADYRLAATGPQNATYCWNQLTIDNLYCGTLRPMSINAACRSQAMQRYAACLAGQPIPPLPF